MRKISQNVYEYKVKGGKKYAVKINKNKIQLYKRGFNSKQEALIYLAGIYQNATFNNNNNYDIKELNNAFLNHINKSVKVTTAYNKRLVLNRYVFPFFADFKLCNIDNSLIEIFAIKINKLNYSDKKRIFRLTKEYLDFLTNYGLPKLNTLCLAVPYDSKAKITSYDYYTREEFNKFLSVIKSQKYRLIFQLFYDYGLRLGELLGIRHCDITDSRLFIRGAITNKIGNKGQIYITTKTKSSIRDYPLITPIYEAYIEYIKTLDSFNQNDFIFKASNKSLTIGPEPIRFAQKKYEKLSGLRHIKIHEFRHSCATELINNGFSPEQVAAWLGHSSSNVTMRIYAHLFPSRKMEIANFYNKQKIT